MVLIGHTTRELWMVGVSSLAVTAMGGTIMGMVWMTSSSLTLTFMVMMNMVTRMGMMMMMIMMGMMILWDWCVLVVVGMVFAF